MPERWTKLEAGWYDSELGVVRLMSACDSPRKRAGWHAWRLRGGSGGLMGIYRTRKAAWVALEELARCLDRVAPKRGGLNV